MKKLCCLLIAFLLLCGCESSKPILVSSANFTAIINIVFKSNTYQYKIIKTINKTTFKPCGDTTQIEFIVNDNCVTTKYKKHSSDYEKMLDNSFISIIDSALNHSHNNEVFADYNGNYITYETINTGEYSLKTNKSGLPLELKVKSKDLYVEFSNVKEV